MKEFYIRLPRLLDTRYSAKVKGKWRYANSKARQKWKYASSKARLGVGDMYAAERNCNAPPAIAIYGYVGGGKI